jgi:hypothetical protein
MGIAVRETEDEDARAGDDALRFHRTDPIRFAALAHRSSEGTTEPQAETTAIHATAVAPSRAFLRSAAPELFTVDHDLRLRTAPQGDRMTPRF